MRIVIISGGNIQETFASGFLSEYKPDRLIAADRGLDFCLRSGFLPDLIVGDFDSLKNREMRAVLCEAELRKETVITVSGKTMRIIRHQPEKDATDTELAAAIAVEQNAGEICFLGATGTRLDHVWGNLSLLYRLREQQISGWIVDANNRISMPGGHEIEMYREAQFGKYVSVLPYGGPVTGLTLTGFHYPLSDFALIPGRESLCVSNEIEEETAVIRWKSGVPVIIESRD